MRTRDTDKEELVKKEAIKLVVADGFDGFSMNKLARACNISVATLYIYYKDRDDLIRNLGSEISVRFFSSALKNFRPDMGFEEGLWQQWQNRASFALANPDEVAFFETIRHSPYGEHILKSDALENFKVIMGDFLERIINNNEIDRLPLDVFWSVAYGPLYTLLSFHKEGKSMGGRSFTLTDEVMQHSFKLVIKALKK